MPESEEDLRRYLREKLADEKDQESRARWSRASWSHPWRRDAGMALPADDPLYAPITFPIPEEPPVAAAAEPPAGAPHAPPPATSLEPPVAAPFDPPLTPGASAFSSPPAPQEHALPTLLRALSVLGVVITLGVAFAQKSPAMWLAAGLAMVVCAGLFLITGRKRDDRAPESIVS